MLNDLLMKIAMVLKSVFGGGLAVYEIELSNGLSGGCKVPFLGKPGSVNTEKMTAMARKQLESVLEEDVEIKNIEFVRFESF